MVYILAWLDTEDLCQKDDEGNTAMHLAIKVVDTLESTRPVRSLIYNGSPTDIPDHNGVLPLTLAKQIENPKMKLDVLKMLQTQSASLKQFLQYESTLRKKKKSWLHMGIYFAFYTFSFLILVLFQFPLYESMIHVYIVVGTFVLATLCYFISICRNPGYINPNKETSFLVSLSKIEFKFNFFTFIF